MSRSDQRLLGWFAVALFGARRWRVVAVAFGTSVVIEV